MAAPKIVKRYANRKLYDTERRCYVTLEDIALMIKAGDEVKVIDNKTRDDLTSVTLAQIIFEAEKKNSFMPLGLLRDLIQDRGASITEFYREQVVDKVQAKAVDIRDSAHARANDFKERAERFRDELGHRVEGVLRKGEADSASSLQELASSSRQAFDDLQRQIEEKIHDGGNLLSSELGRLRAHISSLEERLKGKAE